MNIQIIVVGDTKLSFLKEGQTEYLKRLGHYASVQMISVKEEKLNLKSPVKPFVEREGERLWQKIGNNAFVVALDSRGKNLTSSQLARHIQSWQNRSIKNVIFLIGGAMGLSPALVKKADFTLSLSSMTFTHDMARVILLEQLYRAYTILRGENYHK